MRALMRVIQNALLAHTPLQVTGLRPKSLNNPQCMHQTIKGLTIMNEQLLATGTDRDYAAALDWIKQAAASRTTLSLPGEGPAQEDPVAALLPVITSEHATAIVAQQIRETLSAPWPAPAEGAAAADHGTFRNLYRVRQVLLPADRSGPGDASRRSAGRDRAGSRPVQGHRGMLRAVEFDRHVLLGGFLERPARA